MAALALSLALTAPASAAAEADEAPAPPPEGTPSQGPRAEAEVSYTWALRALHHGEDAEAVALLRRAVEVDPDHGAARWWLGRTLLRLGEAEAGRRELAASLAAARRPRLSPDLLAETRFQIAGESATPELPGAPAELPAGSSVGGARLAVGHLPRWEARLGAAAAADSNPALLADDLVAVLPGGTLAGDESDTVGDLAARLEVHPFYGAGTAGRTSGDGVSLGLVVEARQSLHADLGSLDRTRLAGLAQLAWGGDPAGYLTGPLGHTRVPFANRRAALLLQAGVREDRIDGESYRSSVDVAASLTLRPANRTATRLDLHYRDGDFDGTESPDADLIPDRSGESLVAGVSQYLYFGRRDRYLLLGVAAGERDSNGDFDAELSALRAEGAFPLGGGFHLHLEAAAQREEFDELASNPLFPSFFADRPREDETLRAAATLAWGVTRRLFVVGRAGWADRDAELGAAESLVDLDFERTTVSLGLLWFVDGGGER